MSADYPKIAASPPEPRLRHGTLLAAFAAGGAAVLTVSLLFLPTTNESTPVWPALGLFGVACLLGTVLLGLSAGSARSPRNLRDRVATMTGVVAILAVLGMLAFKLFMPTADQTVTVQFSDPTGRIVLEYCPTLPGSFAGLARPADVAGTAATVPVRVTADICGNPEFTDGIWLYLQRSGVTLGVAGQ
ncbi:hypothetical protein EDD25_3348 [Cryobacterium psychrophilum]|nr:hypothetical protein EDD25_3348 [Cryobacterium psychrophilum]